MVVACMTRFKARDFCLSAAHSQNLITQNTARAMQQRGPLAQSVDLEKVWDMPPIFVGNDQVAIARNFLLGDE